MLFETAPDRFDGHTHTVELDEQGDGISDEQGSVPHAHDIQGGVTLPAQFENYVSDHPGDLMPIQPDAQGQVPQNQQDPNAGAQMTQQAQAPATPTGYGEDSEIRLAANRIMLGEDAAVVANELLFG